MGESAAKRGMLPLSDKGARRYAVFRVRDDPGYGIFTL